MRYLPHTETEVKEMLEQIGVPSIDALFESIPSSHALKRSLKLQPQLSEAELMQHLEGLSEQNSATRFLSFLGAGAYEHHIPPAVGQLLLRSEFYTAYTPYQAEVAQGTLQTIFEFQTLVSQLFGMDVANASMYDGASAAAEAVLMARRITGRKRCLVSEGLHPEYIATVRTYLNALDDGQADVHVVPLDASGRTDIAALKRELETDSSVLVVGYPNFFGCVEDLEEMHTLCHAKSTVLVSATAEAYALALLQAPGDLGVDIAVGEGQSLATLPQYGGPGVGLMSCREQYLRQLPGRLVGETVDSEGQRGFVLTLSTREQHIRRERATSNICTNHGLVALAFTIRVALLGKQGFVHVAKHCANNAHYLQEAVAKVPGYELPYSAPVFNEFMIRCRQSSAQQVLNKLEQENILGGVALTRFFPDRKQDFLISVTEKHKRADLDRVVTALARAGQAA